MHNINIEEADKVVNMIGQGTITYKQARELGLRLYHLVKDLSWYEHSELITASLDITTCPSDIIASKVHLILRSWNKLKPNKVPTLS